MRLENRIQALIAVGASVAANCQPCLQSTTEMALQAGADKEEITEAVQVGKKVRKGAASKMDKFAAELTITVPTPVPVVEDGCGCSLI